MGFSLTSPAPEKCDPTAENRVWGFFGEQSQTSLENQPQSLQPRQGNRLAPTTIASGRTYWPSRDPIEEDGGINLYGMVENNAVNQADYLGQRPGDGIDNSRPTAPPNIHRPSSPKPDFSVPEFLFWENKKKIFSTSLDCNIENCPCNFEATVSWKEARSNDGTIFYSSIRYDLTKKESGGPECPAGVGWGYGSVEAYGAEQNRVVNDGLYGGIVENIPAEVWESGFGEKASNGEYDWLNDIEYTGGERAWKAFTIDGIFTGFFVNVNHVINCGSDLGSFPTRHSEGEVENDAPLPEIPAGGLPSGN
ncbi:hypothetical protein N9891_01355 [bacterium]|nr:hypothetical protein [bacterium]